MSLVDAAAPSAPLELIDSNPALFAMRDSPKQPSAITVPGSSNFDLTLFDITATGMVEAHVPGTLILTLYGAAKGDIDASIDPASWLPLASAPAEPIGGASDLPQTMWMIQGCDLMIYAGSGKMQGMFKSNVASTPTQPVDLTQHPGDITDVDPLYVFAVGASFTPTGTKAAKAADSLCTLMLHSFTMSA